MLAFPVRMTYNKGKGRKTGAVAVNHFFAFVFRMRYILRWSLMKNTEQENLQEHTAETAMIAHSLAVIRRDVFGQECDPGRIAAVALYHDAPEIMTGDLPTPVKYHSDRIRHAYGEIEDAARERLLGMLPEELRGSYEPLLYGEDSPEYTLVKAADRISAYLKCLREEKAGNTEFSKAAEQTLRALKDMHLPEAEYFMEKFLPSFGLPLDEMGPSL